MGVLPIRVTVSALCLLAPWVFAQGILSPVRTSLMIGEGASAILEEYQPLFQNREAVFQLRLPAGIDPSTLVILDPASRTRIIETRCRPLSPPQSHPTYLAFEEPTRIDRIDAEQTVEVLARTTDTRPRSIEVIYTTDQMAWEARYDLIIRGDIANQLEPLSVDFEARYFISNGLARTFTAARAVVRGPDALPPRQEAASLPRGILSLDADSPLADLWRRRADPLRPPQLYALPGAVNLSGGQITAVRFASARRIAAERVYIMDSEQIAISSVGRTQPLRQGLSLRNERRFGLGIPLPPGVVFVVAGAGRTSFRQQALVNHTPAGGRLLMDLGPSQAVVGSRRSLGRAVAKSGFTEETIEVRLVNQLPSPVRVEIVERPPVPLAWDVVRSSRPYEVNSRRLLMDLNVSGMSEERISYTVRLTEPEG